MAHLALCELLRKAPRELSLHQVRSEKIEHGACMAATNGQQQAAVLSKLPPYIISRLVVDCVVQRPVAALDSSCAFESTRPGDEVL